MQLRPVLRRRRRRRPRSTTRELEAQLVRRARPVPKVLQDRLVLQDRVLQERKALPELPELPDDEVLRPVTEAIRALLGVIGTGERLTA